MKGRSFWIFVLMLWLGTALTYAGEFTDNFDQPHNYLAQGVANTGWDGIVGLGTADALDASTTEDGALYLQSTNGVYDAPFDSLGPFLYKVISGDFVATVEVADYQTGVSYNNCGLMVRVPSADQTNGEDWVALDYFPLYNVGIIARYANDGVRTEDTGGDGSGDGSTTPNKWLQIERSGNTFYLRTSTDGQTWVDYPHAAFSTLDRTDMAGLAVEVGVYQCTYTSNSGYAALDNFKIDAASIGDGPKLPDPGDKASDVVRDTSLNWTAGPKADTENVFFGSDSNAVADATVDNPLGVLVSQGQSDATYTPEKLLNYGQTYYWRVDDINQTDSHIYPGDVWSFTVEPYAYPVDNVTATSPYGNPSLTVDGSGMTGDLHSNAENAIWTIWPTGNDVWIQYDLNEPMVLHQMWVWNGNNSSEKMLGIGVNDVSIETSLDGNDWTVLDGVTSFNRAPGTNNYACNNLIDMQNTKARYVRINILSNFGGLAGHIASYALSEVRFYSVPMVARQPEPASGATTDKVDVNLVWRTGRTASSHRLYFSEDEQSVTDGNALLTEIPERRYTATGLDYDKTYYWKVDEVNGVGNDATVYPGPVWSFSTPPYFTVDDFESYNDETNLVFDTWIDGWNNQSTNGAVVGYGQAPYMEKSIVHSGKQSMPYSYDTGGGAKTAEATIQLGGQDWTKGGAKTLVFYVLGDRDNTDGHLYVKINGKSKVSCTANLSSGLWTQVNVDLASSGADLSDVTSLTIGVEGTGSGQLYIDDVRLYRDAPAVAAPTDPGTNDLVAKYSFEGTLNDSSGNHYDASSADSLIYNTGMVGQAVYFDGISNYVNVPIAGPLSSMTNSTFAIWVNIDPTSTGTWQRAFDFGTGTTNFLYLSPRTGTNGPARVAILNPNVSGEFGVTASRELTDGWHDVACVFTAGDPNGTLTLYVDGESAGTVETSIFPKDLGTTTQDWLGQSQFSGDSLYQGLMDEFMIYKRTLSEGEIRYLAGDR